MRSCPICPALWLKVPGFRVKADRNNSPLVAQVTRALTVATLDLFTRRIPTTTNWGLEGLTVLGGGMGSIQAD